ncbi:ATP-binding cassette domain-containing protein [Budviciaceae bacterium CWB-B4]|uniref:ATP-binding cassette domain-containing protein n=1 Tax=Limnobaculum xujianqingii TaxID=2738837 RepID=A0A9D7FVX8_9GAMM|nr:Ig-like domain-containing protein [Limnobaculum xujianqingii]MBK5074721.1 ATP-binding cassette domain-containing protein [Limnobaculum xujianqingii]MBK5177947.1 ATP-binding cassette domain-containing protein [Limnobaculum xujianqingii]
MNTNASLLVNSGSGASQVVSIDSGKPIKIKIQPGSKYLLKNNDNNFAPENVTLLRNGDDLCIILEGDSTPAVIIEGYYISGNSEPLLGMAEDGQLYAYMVTDGSVLGEGYLLENGAFAPAALGGMPLGDGAYLFENTDNDMGLLALWPWFLGAAAVAGIIGNAIYENNKDNGHSDPAPVPAPTPKVASVPTLDGAMDATGSITGPIAYGSFTDEKNPIIYGTGDAGNTITIYDNGQVIGSATVDANGQWSFKPETALNDGSHSITITQTNSDGSTSKQSDDLSFIVDTVAPTRPLFGEIIDNVGLVTGPIANGATTDDARPEVTGTGEAGNTITIYVNGVEAGKAIIDSTGHWTWTPETDLADGHYQLIITETDKAGNVSPQSPTFDFNVDTAAPVKPAVPEIIDNAGDITGPLKPGDQTDDTTPTFNGGGEPGDTIIIKDGDDIIGSTVVDDDGKWDWTPTDPLPDGPHDITIIEVDPDGKESEPSDPINIIIDTIPPTKPVVPEIIDNVGDITGPLKPGDQTDDSAPTFNGGGEPGDTIIIKDGDEIIGSTVVNDDGEWAWTPTDPLPDGPHDITIIEVDPAGNESEPSDPINIIIDTIPPTTPIAPTINDNVGDKTGTINPGDQTDDTKPEFSGEGEPGDVIKIIDNGEVIGSVTIGDDGKWDWTPEEPMAEGDHSITIIEVDPAGNESTPTAPIEFEIDITGSMIGAVILSGRTLSPLGSVVGLAIRFQQAKAALGSLNQLMKMPRERDEKIHYLSAPNFTGNLRLRNVNFSYPTNQMMAAPVVLQKINFAIRQGERVAILGSIGSGKSTLLKVMARLFQPSNGQLMIDNVDATQVDPADWRTSVGYVGQDSRLFFGTLRENVVIGNPSATTEEILAVARMTGLDKVASRHPLGFEMPIGEMGQGISGGQKQLVSLARCLLLKPKILLMDEPTSSMDAMTELQFIQQLKAAVSEQTLILVTHRFSLLELVDRLIVLDEGKVVADGPKEEVIAALKANGKAQ